MADGFAELHPTAAVVTAHSTVAAASARRVFAQPERVREMRNRRGEKRDWLRGDAFEAGLRRLADRLPNLWKGTVLDGELTAGQFEGTMSALLGSKRFRPS